MMEVSDMGLKDRFRRLISDKRRFVVFMLAMIVVCSAVADLLTWLTSLALGGGAS